MNWYHLGCIGRLMVVARAFQDEGGVVHVYVWRVTSVLLG